MWFAGAETPLIQDVALQLPANTLGLIYGRSGAGKTTLLNLIAGLATPTSGNIRIGAPAAANAEVSNNSQPAIYVVSLSNFDLQLSSCDAQWPCIGMGLVWRPTRLQSNVTVNQQSNHS